MSNNEENCDNNCGSCSKSCPDRTEEKHDFSAALNEYSEVRKVYRCSQRQRQDESENLR
jgi:hypothetical protein